MQDGETQILGGLISKSDKSSASRLPFAGDLPMLGRLFGSQQDNQTKTELILAITPRIVRSGPQPDMAQSLFGIGTEGMPKYKSTLAIKPNPTQLLNATATASGAINAPINSNSKIEALPKTQSAPYLNFTWEASKKQFSTNEVVEVKLNIDTSHLIKGLPIEIGYPPDALDVLNVVEGNFLQTNDGKTSVSHVINAETGRIVFSGVRHNLEGATGKACALELHFKTKKAGTHVVELLQSMPYPVNENAMQGPNPRIEFSVK
jgi:general secretion pathway protein D